jgi:hypothetical protein
MYLRSITSSARRQQEAAVATAQERERATTVAAVTAARAARLAAVELAAARAEVEEADAAPELEALHGSSADSSVSDDGSTNDELRLAREAAQEQAAQWAAAQPHGGACGGSLDRRRRADGAPGENARGGSTDGCGRADGAPGGGGRVDGDRGLYRRRSSPSPDRYHGHLGVQAVVRDIGPGGGWPTLIKTNYVEWDVVMRVRLQVCHMWEAVRYDDVDYYEDRWALDALIVVFLLEMQFSLSQKWTAKEAWDAIAATRIGSNRVRKTTLQALCKEWENLAFKLGEDVDDFALRLNTLLQKMVQFGDNTYDEERAIEKLFCCIPKKYKQIARSIESLLDLSTMTIEEAIGHLKVIDGDGPQTLSRPITIGGKLYLTRE